MNISNQVNIGTRVRFKESGNEGTLVDYDQKANLVLVSLEGKNTWISSDQLEVVGLVDQLLNGRLSDPLQFILAMDAYRLLNEYLYNPFVLASSTKIEIFPHQIEEVTSILDNTRIMIADEVGLGKTIVSGLVASELYARGLADRMLFVVPKALVKKWMRELQNRFDIDTVELDSDYVKFMKETVGNPFSEAKCSVTSLDYLKQSNVMEDLQKYGAEWDLIVFDEAHKLVKSESIETMRYRVASILSSQCKSLLLLTATPHDGNIPAFFNRLRLLDPSIVDNERQDLSHLKIRNMKEDVISIEGKEVFPKRSSKTVEIKDTSREEMSLHDLLDDYLIRLYNEARAQEMGKGIKLIITIIRKRASSSIYALRKTLTRRLEGSVDLTENMEDRASLYQQSMEEGEEEEKERFENELVAFTLSEFHDEVQDLRKLIDMAERLEDKDSKIAELLLG